VTLSELLQNEALRRREFPVTGRGAFLAHAAVCPLPRRVTEAMSAYLQRTQEADQETAFPRRLLGELRAQAARILNVDAAEIALVGPTSLGLSLVAAGLPLQAGDNIVLYQDDYPSNVYPWMAWEEKGIELRRVQTPRLGLIRPEDVERCVDGRTRLVALASCHFISGDRLELPAIGSWLRERGVRFCVDGIQTVGAMPTDASQADFLAADAHKWMLGPCAAGLLYVRREVQDELKPAVFGWHNVRCADFVAQPELQLRSDARRYEAGTANLVGMVGLKAALDLLEEVGLDAISAELLRKRRRLVPALQEMGFEVLGHDAADSCSSGIVSFGHPSQDLRALHARMAESGVTVSLRTARSGEHYIRLSPHFYNTDAELDHFLGLLDRPQ